MTTRPGRKQRERAARQRKAERKGKRGSNVEMKGAATTKGQRTAAAAESPKLGAEAEQIDQTLLWHIARMSPGKSAKALEGLTKAKVAVFRPRSSDVVVRRGRRVVRRTPLLVRTAFIGVEHTTVLDTVRSLPGIAEIVSHPEPETESKGNIAGFVMRPARLDPKALQDFADRVAKGEIVQAVGIKAGDNVIIDIGPFASFPAVVDEIVPNDDQFEPPKAKVSVSIFGGCTPIEIGIADLRLVA